MHGAEEEIFYVLGGSGLSWQDGKVYEIEEGDCLAHLPLAETHTLIAGPGGLDVLAYGTLIHTEFAILPRAGIYRFPPKSVEITADGRSPWERDNAAGELEHGDPETERPERIVNLRDITPKQWDQDEYLCVDRDLGRAAGSVKTGLVHLTVADGKLNCPPHCHSAEEELFVVLDGKGVCLLDDEEHPLRRGSVVGRPAGTGVAHAFRGPLTLLAYGTRDTNDVCYYPRTKKIHWRGLGVAARIENLEPWKGV